MVKMLKCSYFSLFMCYAVFVNVNTVYALNKRNDIDLQTCIDNFDVHKDKIIRTQDSKNMGAKYLNEIDLGSREECLRLCCETNECDVFVYEEKNPGSCYLFHCGPPENFKCKFTRHANYSSAVLTINRHLNELENQIKLTKHEQDLTRLRKPAEIVAQEVIPRIDATRLSSTVLPSTTSTVKTIAVNENLPQMPTKLPIVQGRHCSRYQFECRTSGECIAIYNACDGIPQCLDGSDEAPELGCPELATTIAPSPPPPPLRPQNIRYEQTNQLRKSAPLLADNPYQSQQAVVQSNARLAAPIDVSRDNTDFLRPIPDVRNPPANQQSMYNEASMIQSQQQPAFVAPRPSNNNNWIQHQTAANQMGGVPANVQYADKNSHIFNHKESGLQVVDTPDRYKYKGAMQTLHRALALGQYDDTTRGGAGPQYGDINMHNDYAKIPNYYGDVYRPQYQIPDNWQPNQAQINGDSNVNNPYLNDNWQPVQVPQTQPVNAQQNPYRQTVDAKQNWKADLINTKAESKTYEHTIIHEPKELEQKLVQKDKKIEEHQTNNEEHHDHNHEHDNAHEHDHDKEHVHAHIGTAEELKQNIEDLMDGESERPGGAILSLTLGVCLTCVMAILVGCRLRVVRRRMRRGGKSPYAHDADYLVNGMYL